MSVISKIDGTVFALFDGASHFPFPTSVKAGGKGSGNAASPPPPWVSSARRPAACRRARGPQGRALRVAAKLRPSLTAARHGNRLELRSGRKNGLAEVEQKN